MSKVIQSDCGNTTELPGDEIANEFYLSDSARARILNLLAEQEGSFLRIAVEGGGCSGFRNEFVFDQELLPNDFTISDNEKTILAIDEISMELLKGATLEFHKELQGEYFNVNNPGVKSSCGCGKSYSL